VTNRKSLDARVQARGRVEKQKCGKKLRTPEIRRADATEELLFKRGGTQGKYWENLTGGVPSVIPEDHWERDPLKDFPKKKIKIRAT